MTTPKFRSMLALFAPALVLCPALITLDPQDPPAPEATESKKEKTMLVQYLEVVTPDLDETCSALEKVHGVQFGEPVVAFGNARMATLKGGGRIGVRRPMRADEEPVVRPYVLVEDIEAAVKTAEAAGAEFAMYATPMPDGGKFAIYFQGGIQYGLWEL